MTGPLSRVLPPPLDPSPEWTDQAACLTENPDQWFTQTQSGRHKTTAAQRAAIAVCNRCPVESRCLELALERREPWGVWGGKTESERLEILEARL